jgi:uncharacterized protein YecE (DUF72 family)
MIYVGTSGWDCKHWRTSFYPHGLPHHDWLSHYAATFPTVELNGTFYRLPERATFRRWADATQDGFIFAAKASRYLTHIRRLKGSAGAVSKMLGASRGLGDKLGPVLLQLPPNMAPDLDRLGRTLSRFGQVPVAVEPRDERWFTDDLRHVLTRSGAALCLADRGSRLLTPAWRTADWGYIRYHAGRARPAGCYGASALGSRVRLLKDMFGTRTTVYVYFNNDMHACAPRNALLFQQLAEHEGMEVARSHRVFAKAS